MARRNSTSTNTSDDSNHISAGQGISQEIEINTVSTDSTSSETIQENASQSVSNDVSRSETESSTASSGNSFDIDMGNSINTNTSSSRTQSSASTIPDSQVLTINGTQLTISGGNTIQLPEHDDSEHDTYTHDQGLPSTVWNIVHNLDKSPSVTIVDTSGEIVDGKVAYVSSNEINVEFNAAFSGQAYLN